jgi:hypothetical protein
VHDAPELGRFVGRELDIFLAGETDDGLKTQGAVEMYVKVGFRQALKELEGEMLGARFGHS